MIVKNRKGRNRTKLCDVRGCSASAPTLIDMGLALVSNPALLEWSAFYARGRQIDFCPEHSPAFLDVIGAHANLCEDAMRRLGEMVKIDLLHGSPRAEGSQ